MSKLYIHVGLPKTATTTLQESFFSNIDEKIACYAGVFQPRSNLQSDIYNKFIDAVSFGSNIGLLNSEIDNYIKSCSAMILSEEMVLISQPHASWREKLSNLSKLVTNIDYEVVLTVRQPEVALFSYYVELMPLILKGSRQLHSDSQFYSFAVNDKRMEIFHYKTLLGELSDLFDVDRVSFFKFEDVIGSGMDGFYKLFDLESINCENRPLEKSNIRNFVDGYVHTGEVVTGSKE